jgi:hypothetical protein
LEAAAAPVPGGSTGPEGGAPTLQVGPVAPALHHGAHVQLPVPVSPAAVPHRQTMYTCSPVAIFHRSC